MLTIAKSDADFQRLISSNNFDIEAKEYHPLVPQLAMAMSNEKVAVLALQITVFSNGGCLHLKYTHFTYLGHFGKIWHLED